MVAESKERMAEMFEGWTESLRSAMDAGRRTQENFLKSMGDFCKMQPEFEGLTGRNERLTREFVPFVNRNVQTVSECAETTFRSGMDVFKTACESAVRTDDQDVYRRTRTMWDVAFGAARNNFDAFGKAGTRMAENWSEFVRTTCGCCEATPKSASKAAK